MSNSQASNSYSYGLGNSITNKDPEGEILPLLIAAYAAFEVGLSAYDIYTTADTFIDQNASIGEKAVAGGLFVGGLLAPGGGYSQIPKLTEKAKDLVNRAGKAFTPQGKKNVIEINKANHQGVTTCENCGVKTIPAQQSQKGITPPKNETQVDHVTPKASGGSGTPDNGQVLCRDCNIKKSNK